MNRDGARKSVWQDQIRSFSVITPQLATFDVVIVGGGITGVSTALALQKAGKKCLLVEAANIAFGTSGGTTAHLNDFSIRRLLRQLKFWIGKGKIVCCGRQGCYGGHQQ
ncbi:FAD-dependent oxidoreductase [Paenimyroides viscosum]|uniref:FAD-binding oxidoreductase n=1 Tax=Paenimyroides viscosum TaxID=2488729 RepID=A0A3P1B6C7_9FLAO|nr:FAD-dependent oxidoreductase [Paenimyroides viscosum]RRA96529.1 FAD-binding oxidoreductase [Paenimyroides viscosum]